MEVFYTTRLVVGIVLTFLSVSFLDALIINSFHKTTFRRMLIRSLLMNSVTLALFLFISANLFPSVNENPIVLDFFSLFLVYSVSFVVTVVIESFVITYREALSWKSALLIVSMSNIFSSVGLIFLGILP
jgi:hypothetical protein